jgi:hypothetical protein
MSSLITWGQPLKKNQYTIGPGPLFAHKSLVIVGTVWLMCVQIKVAADYAWFVVWTGG